MIRCKRVYEAAAADDGQRVLVDRLWPRNLRKENLHAQWLREVAPSDDLRKALHQGEVDFAGFTQRYQRARRSPQYWYPLLDLAGKGPLTLLYAGKDTEHNNARVLAEWLESELDRRGPCSSPVCYAQ